MGARSGIPEFMPTEVILFWVQLGESMTEEVWRMFLEKQ